MNEIESVNGYFSSNAPPDDLDQKVEQIQAFIARQIRQKRRCILLTSGGTTVPLEKNTVRFIDNFSVGTRGAASAERFLENGYSVLFLHRQNSLTPYNRVLMSKNEPILDHIKVEADGTVKVEDPSGAIKTAAMKYQKALQEDRLLLIPFVTVKDYLYLLRDCCLAMAPLRKSAVFYFAAAVSDFFVPDHQMAEHKIQSKDGELNLTLAPVPKILPAVVSEWAPHAYTVTFKLETDKSILLSKSRGALHRYQHQLVIGNILHTRKHHVILVFPNQEPIDVTIPEDSSAQVEIEDKLVPAVIDLHKRYMGVDGQA